MLPLNMDKFIKFIFQSPPLENNGEIDSFNSFKTLTTLPIILILEK